MNGIQLLGYQNAGAQYLHQPNIVYLPQPGPSSFAPGMDRAVADQGPENESCVIKSVEEERQPWVQMTLKATHGTEGRSDQRWRQEPREWSPQALDVESAS